jgi:putative aldouronate transport system permease protein
MVTAQPARLPSHKLQKKTLSLSIHIVMSLIAMLMLLPFWLVIVASFTENSSLVLEGYRIWPVKFSIAAYEYLFLSPKSLLQAYGVTMFVTIFGTFFGLMIMAMIGYGLARIQGVTRKVLSIIVLFPILFSGGLIPFYLVMTQIYQIKNSLFSLIFPYLVSPFWVLLLRSYFNQLPGEILESAKIDGANELRIFFQIAIPLSMPALATIGLFTLLTYWNDYWLAMLFIRDNILFPLQYLLFQLLNNAEIMNKSPQVTSIAVPGQSLRMAMAVVAAGPAIFISLGLGRYFIRGITLGALK